LSQDTVTSVERPKSAKEAVEAGLLLFKEKKRYAEAIHLFNTAMELKPTEDEAMAALYNLGCAYAKSKQWKPASEAIVRAINDYRLRLSVALKVS
jgi:tetratricopeptide (TPR) repeat protein